MNVRRDPELEGRMVAWDNEDWKVLDNPQLYWNPMLATDLSLPLVPRDSAHHGLVLGPIPDEAFASEDANKALLEAVFGADVPSEFAEQEWQGTPVQSPLVEINPKTFANLLLAAAPGHPLRLSERGVAFFADRICPWIVTVFRKFEQASLRLAAHAFVAYLQASDFLEPSDSGAHIEFSDANFAHLKPSVALLRLPTLGAASEPASSAARRFDLEESDEDDETSSARAVRTH